MRFFNRKSAVATDNPVNPSRRAVLKWLSVGTAALATAKGKAASIDRTLHALADQADESVQLLLHRPQDLLFLEMRFFNFARQNGGDSLTRIDGGRALLVVYFQPQSMQEQAWLEDAGSGQPVTVPGKIMLAGKSRLVFDIPANITSIPLTADALLNWERFDLVVNGRARPHIKKVLPLYKIPPGSLLQADKKLAMAAELLQRNTAPATRQRLGNYFQRKNGGAETLTIGNVSTTGSNVQRGQLVLPRGGLTAAVIRLAGGNYPGPVDEKETALEIPFRLFVSPPAGAGWIHTTQLNPSKGLFKNTNNVYALWHTRLGVKTGNGIIPDDSGDATTAYKIIRALWAVDADKEYKAPVSPDLSFVTGIYRDQRHKIVHESSNFGIPFFVPQPAMVNNMLLTTLGASLDAEMNVEYTDDQKKTLQPWLNVLKWKHIATMGRDHYVEIVEAGYIFPFGHEAAYVQVTARKIDAATGTAANKQRVFVVITQTEKSYVQRDGEDKAFLRNPFAVVRFVTEVTPSLDQPMAFSGNKSTPDKGQFMPQTGGKPFLFEIKAIDTEGNETHLSMPMVFIAATAGSQLPGVVAEYNNLKSLRMVEAGGQKIAIAPSLIPGDTSYETRKLQFGVLPFVKAVQGFLPMVEELSIIEPSYRRMSGNSNVLDVTLVDDNNAGQVFAAIKVPAAVKFDAIPEKSGGTIVPNFSMTGLSKLQGVFGGAVADMQVMKFNPKTYFNGSTALLFGIIKLSDLIKEIGTVSADDYAGQVTAKVQQLEQLKISLAAATDTATAAGIRKEMEKQGQVLRDFNASYKNFRIPMLKTFEDDTSVTTQYVWKGAAVPSLSVGIVAFTCHDQANAISVTTNYIQRKQSTEKPVFNTTSSINDFTVTIAGMLEVGFNKVGFSVDNNAKVDVNVVMKPKPVKFLGVLSFINDFEKLIPADGFSDPPFLDVSTAGVKTGFSLSVPDLQLGAFTLSNIAIGAYVNLPFNGEALSIGFNFCERNQPFTLTISGLGGGGFFGFEADFKGLRRLEAALEFGAAIAINLGVAKGKVSVMGGIYFKMVFKEGINIVELTGYVRMNGCLSVLGLIRASVEFYMGLTAVMTGSKCNSVYGEVTVKVKVSVAFFSKTVSIHTSREFAGAGNDPNFGMMNTEQDWLDYCSAFAAA